MTAASRAVNYSVAMCPMKSDSVERILNDSSGDITKILKMGITEFAIVTYVVRVQDGQSKRRAMNALLEGRSLTRRQVRFVRDVLSRFRID